ncbi:glycerate kinase type-2 family protein [Granulicella arctica]|uniref:glycerate kinase type-2 family protein n=1 Tax=Granulicella arctica TaxID=940613 RepID=UPI0021E05A1C|nr:DUF4147 domain-containing protein [Granulicella arctica]
MILGSIAKEIFLGTLRQVQIPEIMQSRVRCSGGLLHIGELVYPLKMFGKVIIIAIGKAAVPLCETLVPILAPALEANQVLEGIAVGVTPSANLDPRIRFLHGGHPLPDRDSELAADAILQLLAGLHESTLVLFLISGGSSAMVEKSLDEEITLEETALFHSALVHSGLPITQMNALRKHFSRVKAGRLAVAAQPATQCTLLVSDVPENSPHIVGSGPSLPDPSTIQECLDIIGSGVTGLDLPPKVLAFFKGPRLLETPKFDHAAFLHADWICLVSSDDLCRGAESLARRAGFVTLIDNTCDDWDYRDAAKYLIDRLVILQQSHPRVCVISAGEVSVKLRASHGIGGRNQQFVLECARLIAEEKRHIAVLSGGSDGIDGNSLVAGAVCSETTTARAASIGFSITAALEKFDSYPLFEALGDAIHTGPTGTNVRDLRILLADNTAA